MILLSTLALADIPPTPPPNEAFARHTVSVDGLAAHPDFVVMLYPGSGELSDHQVFTAEKSKQDLSEDLLRADFWLMPKADYATWSSATSAEIMRQRTVCAETGEGCAHISRFSPSYAPPTGTIPCKVTLDAPYTVPEGKPTDLQHAFSLTAASATACTLAAVPSAEVPAAASKGGCATASGGSLGAVLGMLMLGLRRRHS